jgi:winged helix DNA-binding protein
VTDKLSLRALNRITLARQLLLSRSEMTPMQAIAHLAGLQAQAPLAPYVGLWTRLAAFRPQQLENLMNERGVLRAHLMRNTVHLVTTADYLEFRPLFQPPMDRALAGALLPRAGGRRLAGVDLAELREAAAVLLAETPLTRVALARALAPRWPGHDPAALAHAASHLLPLVQVPPRGLWHQSGPAAFMLASAWLNDRTPLTPLTPVTPLPPPTPSAPPTPPTPAACSTVVEGLVLRYLAAFGPASVADIQAWSGLTRLREVTERLGQRLRPLAGPDGVPLLDRADALTDPDPDTPAPPRFLPEYDNLLLSYAERSRVIPHSRPVPLPPGNGARGGTLLVDGCWRADWKIIKDQGVLEVRPFVPLSAADRDAVAAEGQRLLGFVRPADAARDVRFVRDGE